MKKIALGTLILIEAGAIGLAMFVYSNLRLQTIAEFATNPGMRMNAATRLATTTWFLPATILASALPTLVAMVAPLKSSRRMAVVAGATALVATAVVFEVLALLTPLFRM